MITVRRLIEELQKFPMDAKAYAYEGEGDCIVIVSADRKQQLGYIPATEMGGDDSDGETVISGDPD